MEGRGRESREEMVVGWLWYGDARDGDETDVSLGASRVFTRVDGTGKVDMVAYGYHGRDGSYGDPVVPAKGSAKVGHDRVGFV